MAGQVCFGIFCNANSVPLADSIACRRCTGIASAATEARWLWVVFLRTIRQSPALVCAFTEAFHSQPTRRANPVPFLLQWEEPEVHSISNAFTPPASPLAFRRLYLTRLLTTPKPRAREASRRAAIASSAVGYSAWFRARRAWKAGSSALLGTATSRAGRVRASSGSDPALEQGSEGL
jgi:hypothetical protein